MVDPNKPIKYKITTNQNLKEISWIWYGFPIGIAAIVLGILILPQFFSIVLFAIGFSLWLPGVIVHLQYYWDNKEFEVNIENEIIEIRNPSTSKVFKKIDVHEILVVSTHQMTSFWNHGNRFPWNQYGFTQIKFKSGEIINLTCLMIDQSNVTDIFTDTDIKKLRVEELLPTIKSKSHF